MSAAGSTWATVPTIPVRYVREMARRSRASSQRRRRALARAGLSDAVLARARFRVSPAQLEAFHRALVEETDDELFGYFERPVPRGTYGTALRLLAGSSHTVGSSLDAAIRFYRLFDRHRYWRVETRGRLASIRLVPRDRGQAASVFFVHVMLLGLWRTAGWLAGRPLPLEEVVLPPRFRAFAPETRFLFGCAARLAPGAGSIAFPADLLRLPVVRRPEEAERYARSSLRALLGRAPRDSLDGRLRALLAAPEGLRATTASGAARRLGVSRATLLRRLARAGTSFQKVKDEVRRDRAIALLATTDRPIEDVAEAIGYSDPSVLQRAFRKWMGLTPGAFRAEAARAGAARR